jgi:hypothetical protein
MWKDGDKRYPSSSLQKSPPVPTGQTTEGDPDGFSVGSKVNEERSLTMSETLGDCLAARAATQASMKNVVTQGITIMTTAAADSNPTAAHTKKERGATTVKFRKNTMEISPAHLHSRLSEWDPFWTNVSILASGTTSKVDSTQPETKLIRTAAQRSFNIPQKLTVPVERWGVPRNQSWQSKEQALVLRMLPVDQRSYAKKRADCHLWPKGTFLQVDGAPISRKDLRQRLQQLHDEKKWEGNCFDVDLVQFITDPTQRHRIELFCVDDEQYSKKSFLLEEDICVWHIRLLTFFLLLPSPIRSLCP